MRIDISNRIGTTSNFGGFRGLLDKFSGAAAGYSLRKLSKSATNAVRVRRSSDNTEQDIGFVGTELDTAQLLAFVGTGATDDGFVTTWYDQAGSNNATQSTAASQPQIVDGGALITENGKPAVDFDGTDDYLTTATKISLASNGWFATSVVNLDDITTASNHLMSMDNLSIGERVAQLLKTDTNERIVTLGFTSTNTPIAEVGNILTTSTQYVLTGLYDGTNLETFDNGNSGGVTAFSDQKTTATNLTIGAFNQGSANYLNGKSQEHILYPTDQSTNRSGIEANINNYYNIY